MFRDQKCSVGGKAVPKFMQTLNQNIHKKLAQIAETRGITVQELIRAVIIPEWLEKRS
jgi:hypothetical protein